MTDNITLFQIVIAIILGVIPSIAWLIYFFVKDKYEPEPKGIILRTFILGAIAIGPALLIQQWLQSYFDLSETASILLLSLYTFLVVALSEEIFKFAAMVLSIGRDKEFDEPLDGLIYGATAGLGFAMIENIFTLINTDFTVYNALGIVALRFITATLIHAIATGMIGYGYSAYRFLKKRGLRTLGQSAVFALVLHGVYNTIIMSESPLSPYLLAALILVSFALFSHLIKDFQVVSRKLHPS